MSCSANQTVAQLFHAALAVLNVLVGCFFKKRLHGVTMRFGKHGPMLRFHLQGVEQHIQTGFAQTENIRAWPHLDSWELPLLLGRCILQGACEARIADRSLECTQLHTRVGGHLGANRQAEVDYLDCPFLFVLGNHHVAWLQIAVKDPLFVGGVHSLGDLHGDRQHVFQRQRTEPFDDHFQRFPWEILEYEVGTFLLVRVGKAMIVSTDDAGMVELAERVGFGKDFVKTSIQVGGVQGFDGNIGFAVMIPTVEDRAKTAPLREWRSAHNADRRADTASAARQSPY